MSEKIYNPMSGLESRRLEKSSIFSKTLDSQKLKQLQASKKAQKSRQKMSMLYSLEALAEFAVEVARVGEIVEVNQWEFVLIHLFILHQVDNLAGTPEK